MEWQAANHPIKSTSLVSEDFERAVSEWDAFTRNGENIFDSSESSGRGGPPYDWLNPEAAQKIIDCLQLDLDSEIDSTVRRRRLGLLRYLSKRYQALPLSLTVREVIREGWNPVAGGGFADIWRGSVGKKPVCLKVLRFVVEQDESARARMRKQFCHEALVWRQLNHPNILPLLGVNMDLFFPSFCFISPWMEQRDIISFLKKNTDHNLLSVFLEVVAGMCYIHSRKPPVIHGDIRGGNILVTNDYRCCLADFGLALVTTDSQSWSMTISSTTTKGSMRWMAPEYISATQSVPNHTSRDIYAFGCTIIEIITKRPPFQELRNDPSVLLSLMSGKRPSRPENVWCPDEIWSLATQCWSQSMDDRPSAAEINDILVNLNSATSTQGYRPNIPHSNPELNSVHWTEASAVHLLSRSLDDYLVVPGLLMDNRSSGPSESDALSSNEDSDKVEKEEGYFEQQRGPCARCRSLQVRCKFKTNNDSCERCLNGGHECAISGSTPSLSHLLNKLGKQEEMIGRLMAHIHQLENRAKFGNLDTQSFSDVHDDLPVGLMQPLKAFKKANARRDEEDADVREKTVRSEACARCKNLKVRCEFPTDTGRCKRCLNGGHECVLPGRKKRRTPPKREHLLNEIQKQAEEIQKLMSKVTELEETKDTPPSTETFEE